MFSPSYVKRRPCGSRTVLPAGSCVERLSKNRSADQYSFESGTPPQVARSHYSPPGREVRHQIGVVQRELRAKIRSAACSRGSAARCAERLCLSGGAQKSSAAPPPVFLCGFGLSILWSCVCYSGDHRRHGRDPQNSQTRTTDKLPAFLFSFFVVKNSQGGCHRLRRFPFLIGTRPTSCDVGYINGVVFDDSRGPYRMLSPC